MSKQLVETFDLACNNPKLLLSLPAPDNYFCFGVDCLKVYGKFDFYERPTICKNCSRIYCESCSDDAHCVYCKKNPECPNEAKECFENALRMLYPKEFK